MKKYLTIALALALLLSAPPCLAGETEPRTLLVGYTDYKGFIEEQSDGTYSGYGAEYLARVAERAGFRLEYRFGQWARLLEELKAGEIDLMCMMQYTPERARDYDYTAYPIGYTQGLFYGAANSAVAYEDFAAFNGLRAGVIRESAMREMFEKYAARNGFACQMVEYESESEMERALETGAIDAMVSEHLANHRNLTLLAAFGADAYYIVSYKGSPYVRDVNDALQQIKTDVDFEAKLYHKYYDSSAAETTLQFTTEERAFIAQRPTIRVGLNGDRAPFAQYDEKTGLFSGICVDVLSEIAQNSGLRFQFALQPPGVKTQEMLDSGMFDVVCGVERDNFVTNESIVPTEAFLESAVVPVGKAGRSLNLTDALTVAIPSSYQALQKSLESNFPNVTIVGYNLNRQGLDAVMSGEADVFVQNTHLLSLLLQEPRYAGLDIVPVEVMAEHTAMALPRDPDSLLLSVLNKSIENLSRAAVSGSLIRHTFASPYQYTLADSIYRFRGQFAVIAALIVLCFGLMGAITVTKQRGATRLRCVNESLEKAVRRADSASAAKSQFLAQMSHEIRTPMNAIIGLTAMAKTDASVPEKIGDYLTKIDSSSRLLLGILNDVLDMSAIEGGKLKIDCAAFHFKRMLTGMITVFYQQAKMKRVDFRVRMKGVTEETVVGDELRMNQVLMNLLSNAVKFTPAGGTVTLAVLQSSHTRDKVQFRFTVTDTGCGMSEEMLSRLFQPFEQESASTARRHGGSGLGLSIAKNLVEMMGGTIGAESELGKGSVFTVDMPFGAVPNAAEPETADFSGLRVLVVDDDPEACEYSGVLLDRLGVKHEYAASGQAALERLGEAEDRGEPFSICLVDWKMPNMDGVEVTRAIRSLYGEETLVIIVSAYDINELEPAGREAGVNGYVPKPLFQSTLLDALMRVCAGADAKLCLRMEKPSRRFAGKRVLLAEDVALNTEVAVALLEAAGIAVTCAEDGARAAELFEGAKPHSFDCVLMDVNMPVMDGYEATRAIRRLPRPDAQTVPIYAMTANAFARDVSAALDAGMNGHIAKPIEASALYETLQTAFDASESREPAGAGENAGAEERRKKGEARDEQV